MPRPKKNTTTKNTVKAEAAAKKTAEKAELTAKSAEAKSAGVTVSKTAEVKAAPAETPKTETRKPAARKTATKKTVEKPVVKEEAPAAPVKRGGRKAKPTTIDDVVAKVRKRIDKTAAKKLVSDGKAAVDIKLYGAFEAHMYIEIKDGAVTVAPYDYIEKDIEAAVPVDVALAIADGKITVKEAVENGSLYVFGNVQFALMFEKLFK